MQGILDIIIEFQGPLYNLGNFRSLQQTFPITTIQIPFHLIRIQETQLFHFIGSEPSVALSTYLLVMLTSLYPFSQNLQRHRVGQPKTDVVNDRINLPMGQALAFLAMKTRRITDVLPRKIWGNILMDLLRKIRQFRIFPCRDE